VQPLEEISLTSADLVGFHLQMHTATRLAGPLIARARRANRRARICAYGLYAPPNEAWLRSLGVDDVLGGEFEGALTAIARTMTSPPSPGPRVASGAVPRLQFLVPDRSGLPPLARYARLIMPDGRRRIVASTEASRGCRHLCRHCPVVPIYNGQFRIVQPDVVLADIAAQVAAGAEHLTFGDPDFFNGPAHALRIVDALHAAHPDLSYDVTIKVEHLLRHRDRLSTLAGTGCAFVTSAVESLDDRVLALLDKGHTRADFLEAAVLCREAGLTLVPTFVAFHPWISLGDYCDLVDTIAELQLVDHVAPIQLAIRLLVPDGSRLLELGDLRRRLSAFDPVTLAYPWSHADPRVDELHRDVTSLVGTRLASDRRVLFDEIRALAHERAGRLPPLPTSAGGATPVPYLNEPWYCCAEPNPGDARIV
jgi:radical SAM family protein